MAALQLALRLRHGMRPVALRNRGPTSDVCVQFKLRGCLAVRTDDPGSRGMRPCLEQESMPLLADQRLRQNVNRAPTWRMRWVPADEVIFP